MNRGLEERRLNNAKILESNVKTVWLCGRQNFALRGHRDDSRHIEDSTSNVGNFQALLDFRVDGGDMILSEHLSLLQDKTCYKYHINRTRLVYIKQICCSILP